MPSPSNRYLRSTYDAARSVPIGNEFDKESRVKELGDIGEGLTMWSKAQDVYKRQDLYIKLKIRSKKCQA